MAVWPNVEYSSAPGAQVSSEIRKAQLSWENAAPTNDTNKRVASTIFFKQSQVCGKIEKKRTAGAVAMLNNVGVEGCFLLAERQHPAKSFSFVKSDAMNDPGKMQKLEDELARLSLQLQDQAQTIHRLQEELRQLSGTKAPAPPVRRTVLPHASLENLIGLRLIHLVGMIVLVIGLSLGVKYAIDANLI